MITIYEIVAEFCERSNSDIHKLTGSGRSEPVVWARYAAIAACIACGFKDSEVARFFNRDRTSIIHARNEWPAKVSAAGNVSSGTAARIRAFAAASERTVAYFGRSVAV